jgi:hypothetical protein
MSLSTCSPGSGTARFQPAQSALAGNSQVPVPDVTKPAPVTPPERADQ